MKVLYIRAEQEEQGILHQLGIRLKEHLENAGIECDEVYLEQRELKACVYCGKCWRSHRCIFNDAVNRVIDAADQTDALITAFPVYYGEPDPQMVRFLERLFHACPERFASKPAACLPLTRKKSAKAVSSAVCEYFAMADMLIVTARDYFAVSGSEEDETSIRRLAEKMTWILRCIEAGNKETDHKPEYERKLDFLR